jgi:hypothetical protein
MGGGMRALKIATIVMGVLIVLGTGVIIVTIVKRTLAPSPEAARAAPYAITLSEPEGTTIVGMAAPRDRLALRLHGGGPDRVILIDPATGLVAGRITLGR